MSVIEPRSGHGVATSSTASDLPEFLGILKARRRLLAAVVLLVVASALILSLTRTPIYESEAQVQTRPVSLRSADVAIALNMETERALASSPKLATIAANELDTNLTPEELLKSVDVSVEPNTEILVFKFTHSDPRSAQRGAQAFADAYVRSRSQDASSNLESRMEPLVGELEGLEDSLAEVQDGIAIATGDAERAALQVEAGAINGRIAIVQQQLDELAQPTELNVAQVLKPAVLPEEPASPNHIKNVILALFVGIALATGIALVAERLDDRLRSRQDLESYAGVPVLAVVPHVRSWRRGEDANLVMIIDPDSPAAEAYRTLRTGVLFDAASHNDASVFLITSPEAGEGKTTTTANLGVALAQAGKKVLLISADLRRPRLQTYFDLTITMGLTNVLAGEERLSPAIVHPFGMNNLSLLPSGPLPGNPAELLSSQSMRSLMMEIRDEADVVLIDAPPVLAVADSLTLAQSADAVLLVADSEKTQRSAIHQTRQHLNRVRARVMGAVLNNFDPSTARTYQAYGPYSVYESVPESLEISNQSQRTS